MRVLLFLTIFVTLCSCNNNLTTIGQDLIIDESSIKAKTYTITETSTVKIDSFETSSGYSSYASNKLYVGRYTDDFSGTTVAESYFQIAPASTPSIGMTYELDSVTFNFNYARNMWGDTITPTLQTLELWQLKRLPELNTDDYNYLFSNDSVPTERLLATTSFLPLQANMQKAHFTLSKEFGLDLFNKMKDGSDIFYDTWSFLQYFKGLVIKPGKDNNCIFSISAATDSLYLRFHFHKTESETYMDYRLTNREYQFNGYKNTPAPRFAQLTNQQKSVSFSDAGERALLQGMSGYMVRMNLPNPPGAAQYTTIIKAEIEINPIVLADDWVNMPSTISVYTTNIDNELAGILYNTSTTPVTGSFVANPANREDNKYVFDVTDYYQRLSQNPSTERENQILLSVPGFNSSFNRVIIDQLPILRIYYATYK